MNDETKTEAALAATVTKVTAFLGKCRQCGGVARVQPELVKKVTTPLGYGRTGAVYVWKLASGETVRGDFGHFFTRCWCGRQVHFKRVVGRLSAKACNDKCMSAHGPSCECSCAGENHGGSFS